MLYQTVLFDFDGVLCHDRFYEKTLLPDYQGAYDWIQANVFGDDALIQKWMRNELKSDDVNKLVAENTDIAREMLDSLYMESVHKMGLDERVENLAKSLKLSGRKIGIVTNNMDVFSEITVGNHQLDKLFDIIVNSADYGRLKKDNNGELFDIAFATLNGSIKNSLMIDDSASVIELYERRGGKGFLYKDFEGLESFLRANG
ncbi:MAG: HAD family hydrolase [Patescibacteria group bacterium]